jgi:hypothetical protein
MVLIIASSYEEAREYSMRLGLTWIEWAYLRSYSQYIQEFSNEGISDVYLVGGWYNYEGCVDTVEEMRRHPSWAHGMKRVMESRMRGGTA